MIHVHLLCVFALILIMSILWSNTLFRLFSYFFSIMFEPLCTLLICFLLLGFLVMRSSYSYGMIGYVYFLFLLILPIFFSLFFWRLLESCRLFFSGFVPLGSPLWISPFVSMAELISYIVRPGVLLFRPFINLSVGCYGGLALGSFSFYMGGVGIMLFILFLYEVFVAVMHWFIVREILSFSIDH